MPTPKKTNRKRFIPASTRCTGVKKDGTPCMMSPLPGDKCCWTHSTSKALVKERAEARRKGGLMARNLTMPQEEFLEPSLSTGEEIRGFCQRMICLVGTGRISSGNAKAIAVFVQQVIQMHDLDALEYLRELEKRMGRLALEKGVEHESTYEGEGEGTD